ncbi:hypothetical protein ACFL6I_11080 [candidate division KSB1 bacterium]
MIIKNIRKVCSFFSIKRLVYIWGIILASFFFNGSVHYLMPRTGEYIYGHHFSVSQGGYVFLLSKLNQIGLLKDYLDKSCDKKEIKLCEYKDSIPTTLDFIWANSSPLYKTGGWYKNKKEFQFIIQDILTTPKYLFIFIYKSIESSFTQFFSFNAPDLPIIKEISYSDQFINECYGFYKNEYLESLQNHNELNQSIHSLNTIQIFLFGFSLFLLIIILLSKVPLKYKLLGIFILVALYVNALVCSSLSVIESRYQSRIMWLIILPIILTCSNKDIIKTFIAYIRNKFNHN